MVVREVITKTKQNQGPVSIVHKLKSFFSDKVILDVMKHLDLETVKYLILLFIAIFFV